ncbi:hypothetical protein [Paractinoplanes lichenicola]|uniref:Uncharacterized protein n=1 Tax=Paractinoplanes lichenicola TaxID=2802976 RepID=A0ABS1VXV7_9ACTN|nr:hypothetical protein [Actinoplanes lichenicola]MBL7259287.1 hypothetical protein [Actinoplanes lichenicola]
MRHKTLAALALLLIVVSGWLAYTLILEETHLEPDANSRLDSALLIGIPALLGVGLAIVALRRRRRPVTR